jgi:phenylalanyl-tRNA synthetase beta chain
MCTLLPSPAPRLHPQHQHPRTANSEEFQIGRTAIVPGLLKSLHCNRSARVSDGLKLFEVSDVMLLDAGADVGARNERHVALLYSGATAGLEVIHGLVDKVMQLLEIPVRPYSWEVAAAAAAEAGGGGGGGRDDSATYGKHGMRYAVVGSDSVPSYFPGRGAEIIVERPGKPAVAVGHMGILHPAVLKNFELSFPCSVAEINVEMFV